jgi:hypothetical protein
VTYYFNTVWRFLNRAGSFDYHIVTIGWGGGEGLQNTEVIREAWG